MDMIRTQLIRHWTVGRGPGGIAAVLFDIEVPEAVISGGPRLSRVAGFGCREHIRPEEREVEPASLGDAAHPPLANRGRPDLAKPRNFSGAAKLVDDL